MNIVKFKIITSILSNRKCKSIKKIIKDIYIYTLYTYMYMILYLCTRACREHLHNISYDRLKINCKESKKENYIKYLSIYLHCIQYLFRRVQILICISCVHNIFDHPCRSMRDVPPRARNDVVWRGLIVEQASSRGPPVAGYQRFEESACVRTSSPDATHLPCLMRSS